MEGMDVLSRIKQFADSIGVSKNKLEVDCGLSRGYMSGKASKPTIVVLERIHAVYPDLNMNWVLFGEGNMLLSPSADVLTSSADKEEIARLTALLNERTEALAIVQSKYIALFEKVQELESLSHTA